VLAHPERTLTGTEVERLAALVRRRARREPFAQIVGRREFYGLNLAIDRRVLTPRPETELLVEEGLRIVEEMQARGVGGLLVVDVGTGSGAIALAVATHAPAARVIGVDVSGEALEVARTNHAALDLTSHVNFVRADLLGWLRRPVDLVLANLPYLPTERIPDLMPEVARYEPRAALDGGADGLDLVRRLLGEVACLVRPGGSILLELDPEQVEPARALLPAWAGTVLADLAGDARVLRLDAP
jgi:release factor glutamine methyltransferase